MYSLNKIVFKFPEFSCKCRGSSVDRRNLPKISKGTKSEERLRRKQSRATKSTEEILFVRLLMFETALVLLP